MKRTLAAIAAATAMTAIVAPTASAAPPNTLDAVAVCDEYGPIEATARNTNAAFFNQQRRALVGITATASGAAGPRAGVVFADVVDGVERTLRGQKPYDERGFDTTRCDIFVYDFPFEGDIIPVVPFYDVQVKLAPSR